jgi:hypothetical protein
MNPYESEPNMAENNPDDKKILCTHVITGDEFDAGVPPGGTITLRAFLRGGTAGYLVETKDADGAVLLEEDVELSFIQHERGWQFEVEGLVVVIEGNAAYQCGNDRYCPDSEVFYSVEEFLDYCQRCFGSSPVLQYDAGTDTYSDDSGLVLEPVDATEVEPAFWTDGWGIGWTVGHQSVTLNPSDGGSAPDVFVYEGFPSDGSPRVFVPLGLPGEE